MDVLELLAQFMLMFPMTMISDVLNVGRSNTLSSFVTNSCMFVSSARYIVPMIMVLALVGLISTHTE